MDNSRGMVELAFYEHVIGESPNLRAYEYKTTTVRKAILGHPLGEREEEFWMALLAEVKALNRVPDVVPASIPGEAAGYTVLTGGIVPAGMAWGGINGVHANFMIRDRPDGIPNPWKARINAVIADAGKTWWCQLSPDERMKIRTVLDEMDGVAAAAVMKSNAGDYKHDTTVFLRRYPAGLCYVTPQEARDLPNDQFMRSEHIASLKYPVPASYAARQLISAYWHGRDTQPAWGMFVCT